MFEGRPKSYEMCEERVSRIRIFGSYYLLNVGQFEDLVDQILKTGKLTGMGF